MTFGDKIKKLRREKNWTQDKLGEMVNMHGRYISKYELGQVSPTAEAIIKFAKVFNVSADYLLFDEDHNIPSDITDEKLSEVINELKKMNKNDKKVIISLIDAYVKKNQIENIIDKK